MKGFSSQEDAAAMRSYHQTEEEKNFVDVSTLSCLEQQFSALNHQKKKKDENDGDSATRRRRKPKEGGDDSILDLTNTNHLHVWQDNHDNGGGGGSHSSRRVPLLTSPKKQSVSWINIILAMTVLATISVIHRQQSLESGDASRKLPQKHPPTTPTVVDYDEPPVDIKVQFPAQKHPPAAPTAVDDDEPPVDIKVQFPVFVASIFRSGAMSSHNYFKCGGQNSVNFHMLGTRTGPCIKQNIEKGRNPFHWSCGSYDVWANNAYFESNDCFEPAIHGGMEAFYKHNPRGTILLTVRDSYEWMESVLQYKTSNFSLLDMITQCRGPGYFTQWKDKVENGGSITNEDVRQYYLFVNDYVRKFAADHPSLAFIEVPLNSNETGAVLEEHIGIKSNCWDVTGGDAKPVVVASTDPTETGNELDGGREEDDELSVPIADIDDDAPDVKVPFPIFVASIFKSGTTSLHQYFRCGKQKSVHYRGKELAPRTGPCIQQNVENGRDPFKNCGDFDIWSDNAHFEMDYCFEPSIHGLEAIYESHPNATIMLSVRDSYEWLDSVIRYNVSQFSLLKMITRCRTPGYFNRWNDTVAAGGSVSTEDVRQYYLWVNDYVRKFAADHPSMTFIEVSLNSNETATVLEDRVGIPKECWKAANVNTWNKKTSN